MNPYAFKKPGGLTYYSFLELHFSSWRWVRRRSKAFWARRAFYDEWVKYTDEEVAEMQKLGVSLARYGYEVEDWRPF